jgi:radical SAM family uncharacterized protein/radical SAM-linked protein
VYEDFLPLVEKPARYIDSEINAVHKDWSSVRTRFCLFFPDTYEVGMSHLGLRILYDILNSRNDTVCERVFSPWLDYEQKLRAARRPLTSLESGTPLADFDIIGITLQYELSYTNVLAGLDLARIPLLSRERRDSDPVIVAGGPCAVNPEPLSGFIDVFFIGEAEEAINEIVGLKQAFPGRRQFLEAIAKHDGFYVPAFGRSPVRRRYLKDIDRAPYPEKPILPLFKPVHDRVTVEVARGCIRGCRFCQAGIIYRPFRERSPERVKNILRASLACTGYEELSLASLSSGDYSSIEPLVIDLMNTYRGGRVSVSLPSLRVGTLTAAMIEAIAGTRKTGFTLAPEAGTERLRRVINKPVSDQDLFDAAETIFRNGWSVMKLYFMIGLPTETDEDLDGIVRLGNELLALGKRVSKRHVQINISVSTFVPKPHTPFQWTGQAGLEEIKRKQAYLAQRLRKRGITLKPHQPEMSLLEGAFARGDRALGSVIAEAVRRGCRFDGWTECFDFGKWKESFAAQGLSPDRYASRTLALDEELAWGHIRTGVTTAFLQSEYRRAVAAETTGHCRAECMHCGIGCGDGGTAAFGRAAGGAAECPALGTARQDVPMISSPDTGMTSRIRAKYTRLGKVRFLSHLDFMTLFHRAAVRAGVPIVFSQGFNPHPRIAFGPALSVGIESESEFLDLEITATPSALTLVQGMNDSLPQGIRITEARIIPRGAPSLSGSINRYEYVVQVPAERAEGLQERVQRFLGLTSVLIIKEGRSKEIRPCIEAMDVVGPDLLLITLQDRDQIKPRVQDVISRCFELDPEAVAPFPVKRTGLYCRARDSWTTPFDV